MKYSKLIKTHIPDILLIMFIVLCFCVYSVIYMTPSRVAWYRYMRNDLIVYYQYFINLVRKI